MHGLIFGRRPIWLLGFLSVYPACAPSPVTHPSWLLSFLQLHTGHALRDCNMGAMQDPSAVKVYTVNGEASGSSSALPDWLTQKRQAKGKGKRVVREQVEGTIELIQDFEFPEASNKVKTTRDGHHAVATGTYKPQIRVWDLDQLSLKFERHTDAENVDFVVSESFCMVQL